MRSAKVYFKERLAGVLSDFGDHYEFLYDSEYLKDGFPISCTLPLKEEAYSSINLFPFFDGLIVEGWLLDVATKNWKVDQEDRMSLLLLMGKDTIGAVSVEEIK